VLACLGPVLSVRVGKAFSSADEHARDTPAPAVNSHTSVKLQAKVDTGSYATVVPLKCVGKGGLDLDPVGTVKTNTASHKGVRADVFLVSIEIQGKLHIPACYVLALDTFADTCLIGRDLLQTGWLDYRGQAGEYTLHLGDDLAKGRFYPFWLV